MIGDDGGDDGDDRGDDVDDRGDEAKAKRDNRDDGETQEMKKTMMEEGRIAPSMRDGEGRQESHFNGYLYLIQAIYMESKASTATRVGESEAELAT